jgi:cytochrome P450
MQRYCTDVCGGTGPILRVAPQMYSIDDPDAMNTIYGVSSDMPKTAWYEPWGDMRIPNHNLFTARDRKFHSGMRRKVANMYSMTSIKSYEPYVNRGVALLLRKFDEVAMQHRTIDLQQWMQCYAFDVISEITVRCSDLLS